MATTLSSVMADLRSRASEKTRITYIRHGAPSERTLGVSVADQKLMAKSLRKQQALACELFETGTFEAMYLAGLVADGTQLTREQLERWAEAAVNMPMISEYTIPWLAVENRNGRELAREWIKSKKEHVASAGWSTYSGLVATQPDDALDLGEIAMLLETVAAGIHSAPNRVRCTMNGFVISVGTYVETLHTQATATAEKIGVVWVDMGATACKVRSASERLAKMKVKGGATPKRKTIRC